MCLCGRYLYKQQYEDFKMWVTTVIGLLSLVNLIVYQRYALVYVMFHPECGMIYGMLQGDGCFIPVSPCVVLLYSDNPGADLTTKWIKVCNSHAIA